MSEQTFSETEILDAAASVVKENAELRAELEATRKAAHRGMDAAKHVSSEQLRVANRMRAESKPEAVASERLANSILTEENEALQSELAALRQQVDGKRKKLFYDLPICCPVCGGHAKEEDWCKPDAAIAQQSAGEG